MVEQLDRRNLDPWKALMPLSLHCLPTRKGNISGAPCALRSLCYNSLACALSCLVEEQTGWKSLNGEIKAEEREKRGDEPETLWGGCCWRLSESSTPDAQSIVASGWNPKLKNNIRMGYVLKTVTVCLVRPSSTMQPLHSWLKVFLWLHHFHKTCLD